uniref:Uncharacterized protein n=1 Tax=Cucumis melo TaxID=3656 RepID=A0A9I9DBB5_CUCME
MTRLATRPKGVRLAARLNDTARGSAEEMRLAAHAERGRGSRLGRRGAAPGSARAVRLAARLNDTAHGSRLG